VLQEQGVVDATVTTTVPMAADRQAALSGALGKAAGGAQVRLATQVDPALIGGVVARVGSVVYDGSVARQLEKIKSRLIADA
jgi:F-type H+-transporting ATPase subunit delta